MRIKATIGGLEPESVSFEGMRTEPGVYRADGYPEARFISFGQEDFVLFVDTEDGKMERAEACWERDRFIRVDEDIEITFKRRSE